MTLSREAVESVIRRRLEPLFSLDGGSVSVVGVDAGRGEVVVAFGGSYDACPGRTVIVERVIEPTLRSELSGVSRVRMG
jgi:Fe-S cluster biogenesis protein NfuA